MPPPEEKYISNQKMGTNIGCSSFRLELSCQKHKKLRRVGTYLEQAGKA